MLDEYTKLAEMWSLVPRQLDSCSFHYFPFFDKGIKAFRFKKQEIMKITAVQLTRD